VPRLLSLGNGVRDLLLEAEAIGELVDDRLQIEDDLPVLARDRLDAS
jgi:hypothetical protein